MDNSWWKHERFVLPGILPGDQVYVTFVQLENTTIPNNYAGWYIDDVVLTVEEQICDLTFMASDQCTATNLIITSLVYPLGLDPNDIQWEITTGAGVVAAGTGLAPTFVPTVSESITITAEITSGTCIGSTFSQIVTVISSDITSISSAVNGIGSFTFTGTTAVGDPDLIEWDYGDGTTGTGSSVNHAYTQNGTYTVTANFPGESCNHSLQVVINDIPDCGISFSLPSTVCLGSDFQIGNLILPIGTDPNDVAWDVVDNGTSQSVFTNTGFTLGNIPSTAGDYEVTLTLTVATALELLMCKMLPFQLQLA